MTIQTTLLVINTGGILILVLAELTGIYLVTKKHGKRTFEDEVRNEIAKGYYNQDRPKQLKDVVLPYEEMKFKIGGKSVTKQKAKKTTKPAKASTAVSAAVTPTYKVPKAPKGISKPAKKEGRQPMVPVHKSKRL